MKRWRVAIAILFLIMSPLAGSLAASDSSINSGKRLHDSQITASGQTDDIPIQEEIWWDTNLDWWAVTSLDKDRNGIHDSLQDSSSPVNVGLSFSREVTDEDEALSSMGFNIQVELPVVDAFAIGGYRTQSRFGI